MIHLKLIVTGSLEERALGGALSRAFPAGTFDIEVAQRLNSFTSERLTLDPTNERPDSPVRKLAAELVASVEPGRSRKDGPRPDRVVLVEDLEPVNWDQPAVVIACLRRAVEQHLGSMGWNARTHDAVRERLRERCSFHLLVPMVEGYFLTDPETLHAQLKLPAQRRSCFDPIAADVEDVAFDIADPALAAGDGRRQHPKRYLNFLCDPSGENERAYRETKQGAAILTALRWDRVFASDVRLQYLRALFDDLAWGLDDVAMPFPGVSSPLTRVRDGGLLRNVDA